MSSIEQALLVDRQTAPSRLVGAEAVAIIASRIWSAIPMPAVPAPKIDDPLIAHRRVPATRTAPSIAASTIAPVPCMSSLKIRAVSRYSLRIRRALDGPKSSQCSIAAGNSRLAVST